MSSTLSELRFCLICKRKVSINGLINHIASHLNYNRHKCTKCSFRSVSVEDMVDHQNQTGHIVKFDELKNWYLERVCQLIYSDFDYAEKHGIDTIRIMGSAYGDRERLLNLLQTDNDEIMSQQELVTVDDPDEEVQTVEDESEEPSPTPSPPQQQTPQKSGIDLLDQWTRSIEKINSSTIKNTSTSVSNNNNLIKDGNSSINDSSTSTLKTSTNFANIGTSNTSLSTETENLTMEQTTKNYLAELQNQITNGIPKRTCSLCYKIIDNDYRSMKNHVFRLHFGPPHKLNKFTELLEKCFKKDNSNINNNNNVFITNDLQCNVCGREIRSKPGRFNHVAVCHSNYTWNCIYINCNYKFSNWPNFSKHLLSRHDKKYNQLEYYEKDRYYLFKSNYESKLTPLVRKCFPFELPAILLDSNSFVTDEDLLGPVDEIVSNFMPTREIKPILCRKNALKILQLQKSNENNDEEMVDPSSDEDDNENKNNNKNKIDEKKKDFKKEVNKKNLKNNNNTMAMRNGGGGNIKYNKNVGTNSSGGGGGGQVQRYNSQASKRTFKEGFARIFVRNIHGRRFRYKKRRDDDLYY